MSRVSERIYRLYVPDLGQAGQSDEVSLPHGEVHHALHVLRLRQGEAVELFDGLGRRCCGSVASIARSSMAVRITGKPEIFPRRTPVIALGFAVPKGNRLDYLLEKATELAVASIEPVIFQRSVAGAEEMTAEKQARWLGHCIAAAKQSALDYLPSIAQPTLLEQWVTAAPSVPEKAVRLMGDASMRAVSISQALPPETPEKIFVLIGPEGGITDEERNVAVRAGFVGVRIGWTTLRVETAAVAMLSAVNAIYT